MKIGNTSLRHGIILAPMAGYTDRAMRLIAREHGAEYSVTEMVSAKAVTFGDKKTHTLARIKTDEGPVALQLFGSEPETVARAADIMQRGEGDGFAPPVAIDINMGCPVNKIFSNGEGSALMKDPELIFRIVKAAKENIDIPLTVKIRAGIDSSSINAVECALAAESAGACAIAVHGRTRKQLYGGTADLEIIKNVKQALHIPVIANGDIVDARSAINALSVTGADGIMVGRGAVGNPFIFSEIICALEGVEWRAPTLAEKKQAALRQIEIAALDKGEYIAVTESRKQIALYFKSYRGSAAFRRCVNSALTIDEIRRAFDLCEESIG
jgi:nifR3 family TIM-barrel protein